MITVEITEPTEYIDRSFETASWWVKYELQPGTYEVVPWSNIKYYFHFQADAVTVEEHFVNRLFGSSSLAAQSARVGKATKVWVGFPAGYYHEDDEAIATYIKQNPTFAVTIDKS